MESIKNHFIKDLKAEIKPNTNLIIHLTKVSKSGMLRHFKVYTIDKKTSILLHQTTLLSSVLDLKEDHDGLKVQGCGMNMAFWLVDQIQKALYPNTKNKLKYQVIY